MCKLRTLIEQTIYAQRPHAVDLCNLYVLWFYTNCIESHF